MRRCSSNLRIRKSGPHQTTTQGARPHHPVRLLLRGDARRKMARRLTRPSRIDGILHHGPPGPPGTYFNDADTSDNLNLAVQNWYRKARQELRYLDPTSKPNELTEPKFVWTPAVGPTAKIRPGICWSADLWRSLARRATECNNLFKKPCAYKAAIIWRHIGNMQKDIAGCTKDFVLRNTLDTWMQAFMQTVLHGDPLQAGLLAHVADKHAAKHEDSSRNADSKAWKRWATDGNTAKSGGHMPSRGAYRWTREVAQWVDTGLPRPPLR